jgi:hypothetical protein
MVELRRQIQSDPELALAITTGQGIQAARLRYSALQQPDPLLWITRCGSERHVGDHSDLQWQRGIGRARTPPATAARGRTGSLQAQLHPG